MLGNRESYYSKKDHCWDDHEDFDSVETEKNIAIAKVHNSGNSCVKVKVDAEFEAEFEEEEGNDDAVGGIGDRKRKKCRKC